MYRWCVHLYEVHDDYSQLEHMREIVVLMAYPNEYDEWEPYF